MLPPAPRVQGTGAARSAAMIPRCYVCQFLSGLVDLFEERVGVQAGLGLAYSAHL